MGIFTAVANTIAGSRTKKEGKNLYNQGLADRDSAMASRQDLLEPDSLKKNVSLAEEQLAAKSRIQELMENNADRSLARGLSSVGRYASDSSSALQYALGVQDQASQDMNNAALAGAQDEARRRNEFYQQQDKRTQFGLTQYDLNVMQPYLQRLQFANDKVGAGQNMTLYGRQQQAEGFGGILDGIASIGVSALTGGLGGVAQAGSGLKGLAAQSLNASAFNPGPLNVGTPSWDALVRR